MRRPSNRELFNKIRDGKKIVSEGKIRLVNSEVIAEDADELSYQTSNLKRVLSTLLDELKTANYVGGHPPHKSYESVIKDSELFEFKWRSKRFGCNVYLKYCLKGRIFYLVSLHKDRPKSPK